MTTFLLDVNVLIALVDPNHVHHDAAHAWFARVGKRHFATCPITENGLLRVVGNPRYPGSPGPPSAVLPSLVAIRALPGHEFWPDDVSLASSDHPAARPLSTHSRVTDGYLVALARSRRGRLATFDHRLAADLASDERSALEIL